VRVKSAVLAVFILFLLAAGGCSKSKKSEETPAATSTTGNTATAATGATTQPAQVPPAAEVPQTKPSGTTGQAVSKPVPRASAKPPAAKKRVVAKAVVPEESAEPAAATEHVAHKPVTLPEGTVLTVRLNERISSKQNSAGDKFTATIEEPVEVHDRVVIPKGSSVAGTVAEAKARGKIKGSAALRLVLDSVTVKETKYDIQTSAVARSMEGKGKRTAALGGGGAATGALIGGLAGGAKGFGIGMVVGAGVGLAGGTFTGNKNIELPAETVLSFRLLQPVEIRK